MGVFRRRTETLNEQLLREAGLDPAQALGDSQRPQPLQPPKSLLSELGLPHDLRTGPKEWDTTVTVAAPGLTGDRVEFTTIPDGDLIVSDETGDADLSVLADAVERHVSPPYRAVGQRQEGDLWAVGAKRIAVAEIPFTAGSKLELFRFKGEPSVFRVDGEPREEPVPLELERLGENAGDGFYVQAQRIDGDLWEVEVTAL